MPNEPVEIVATSGNKPKQSFLRRNKDKLKTGLSVGFSFAGLVTIIAGVVLHLINPAMGFVSLGFAAQAVLTAMIEHSPKSISKLKQKVSELLDKEDPSEVASFVDEVISKYSNNTARTNQSVPQPPSPPETPNEQREKYNAYYSQSKNTYVITPRT